MGFFGDVVSRVLTEYKADTSDHISSLKKLKGEERARAQSLIEDNERVKESLEGQIKSIARVTAAITAVAGAYLAAKSAFTSYAEHTKLEAAASGVSIDKLRDATKGLKTNTELLADAARLNNGVIKLSTEQMTIAEQAMLQYTRQGHDNAKAHDAVLQAVTALKLDGLKDLGVFIDTTGLSMDKASDRGKILDRVFVELTKASSTFANQTLSDAEKIEASANRLSNAIDKLKVKAGQGLAAAVGFVEEFGEAEAERLMRMMGATGARDRRDTMDAQQFYRDIVNSAAMRRDDALLRKDYEIAQRLSGTGAQSDEYFQGLQRKMIDRGLLKDPGAIATDLGGKLWEGFKEGAKRGNVADRDLFTSAGSASGEAFGRALLAQAKFVLTTDAREGATPRSTGFGREADTSVDEITNIEITRRLQQEAKNRGIAGERREFWDLVHQQRKSFMESTFGPLDQFDAYKAAFDGFAGAVTAGYSAMVDGTMGFGKAFKLAVAQALKASGAQMLIESLKEAAYGVASIAIGNGASAAAHFKSSAMFLAGSVAAGVAANALGGGGGGAASAGAGGGGTGSAAPRPSSGGTSDPGQRTVVHIIGDPFDTESNPRRRLNNAKKIQRQLDSNNYAVDK